MAPWDSVDRNVSADGSADEHWYHLTSPRVEDVPVHARTFVNSLEFFLSQYRVACHSFCHRRHMVIAGPHAAYLRSRK